MQVSWMKYQNTDHCTIQIFLSEGVDFNNSVLLEENHNSVLLEENQINSGLILSK